MYKLEDIKQIHLEITQKCQAACPMCDRNQNGGALNPHINLDELKIEHIKEIFSPTFIKQLTATQLCGNLGDPIIAEHTLETYQYFREHNKNMWLSMNTMAGAKTPEWWAELARTFGRKGAVIFSVDGLENTNHLYRQGVNWENCMKNSAAFISKGGRARWEFIIFDHNQHQIEEARELAKKMRFDDFRTKKTGRRTKWPQGSARIALLCPDWVRPTPWEPMRTEYLERKGHSSALAIRRSYLLIDL